MFGCCCLSGGRGGVQIAAHFRGFMGPGECTNDGNVQKLDGPLFDKVWRVRRIRYKILNSSGATTGFYDADESVGRVTGPISSTVSSSFNWNNSYLTAKVGTVATYTKTANSTKVERRLISGGTLRIVEEIFWESDETRDSFVRWLLDVLIRKVPFPIPQFPWETPVIMKEFADNSETLIEKGGGWSVGFAQAFVNQNSLFEWGPFYPSLNAGSTELAGLGRVEVAIQRFKRIGSIPMCVVTAQSDYTQSEVLNCLGPINSSEITAEPKLDWVPTKHRQVVAIYPLLGLAREPIYWLPGLNQFVPNCCQ